MSSSAKKKYLGDYVDFQNGYAFKSSDYTDKGHYLIRIKNVQQGFIEINDECFVDIPSDTKFEKFKLKNGDIVVSLTGNVGRIARIKDVHLPAVLNQRVASVAPKSEKVISPEYLYYLLRTPEFLEFAVGSGKGAAQQNISTSDMEKYQVSIPSLEKQGEIVEKLDSAFTEIDSLEKNLNSLDSLIAECDFSILEQILTPNENQLANHRSATLGEISELISRGISPSYLDTANTFVLNQRCIRNGSINLDFARRHNEKVKKVQETKLLRDGDGLINSTGVGTLGRTALFKKYGIGEYTVDSHVTIVRPKLEVLNPDYFGLVLKALENVFVSLSTGTSGQTELPRESVRETSVTFPINLADQVDFYEYYSSINYALGDSIKSVAERRSLVLNLRLSFLSSAFSQDEVVA
jgi:type I restriction enzyme S subunit